MASSTIHILVCMFLFITPCKRSFPITAPPNTCAVDGIPAMDSKTKDVAFPLIILLYFSVKAIDSGMYALGFAPVLTAEEMPPKKLFLNFKVLSMDCMNNKTVVLFDQLFAK